MSNPFTAFAKGLRERPAFAAFVGLTEPLLLETLLRDGFDTAILDMQHGSHTVSSAIHGIGAAAVVDKPVFVRPPVGDFATASKMLDAGAVGIIAPMVNTVNDAKQLSAYTKYPPLGARSWGPFRASNFTGLAMGDYLKAANEITLTIAMIETREALAALDGILAVPGIDGVFVGPSDLSIALTDGATVDSFHPEVDAALTHVVNRARAHGKIASCFAMNGKRAAEMIRRGYHMSSVATDLVLLKQVVKSELAAARG